MREERVLNLQAPFLRDLPRVLRQSVGLAVDFRSSGRVWLRHGPVDRGDGAVAGRRDPGAGPEEGIRRAVRGHRGGPSRLGLNPDEIAFCDALANNESAVRELGDEVLKKIAVEIAEKLRESTTVDWQVRDSVSDKLRILVRRCLQKWKYPPDQRPNAVELVLSQAEKLAGDWSS